MVRIVKVVVEDAPKGLFLISHWNRVLNGKETKCCDIMKPHKVAHMIDECGELSVQYYTEDEWNGRIGVETLRPRDTYYPGALNWYTYIQYINGFIELDTLYQFVRDGQHPFTDEDLDSMSLELKRAILWWDGRKPFEYGNLNIVQTKQEEEEGTFWYVDSISFK